METWKDIEGYEGHYQASNLGRINGIKNKKILKGIINKDGYLRVTLSKYNIRINHSIHRLVLKSFIPNPENKPSVNHKNSNRSDNRIENLEWCTPKENIDHAWVNGRMNPKGAKGESSGNSKLTDLQVLEIRSKYIPRHYSHRMLANEYNIDHRVIGKIIKRQSWQHI